MAQSRIFRVSAFAVPLLVGILLAPGSAAAQAATAPTQPAAVEASAPTAPVGAQDHGGPRLAPRWEPVAPVLSVDSREARVINPAARANSITIPVVTLLLGIIILILLVD